LPGGGGKGGHKDPRLNAWVASQKGGHPGVQRKILKVEKRKGNRDLDPSKGQKGTGGSTKRVVKKTGGKSKPLKATKKGQIHNKGKKIRKKKT